MNNLKRESSELELSSALDRLVEAAVNSKADETKLVNELLGRLHSKAVSNVIRLQPEGRHKLYNSEAGP